MKRMLALCFLCLLLSPSISIAITIQEAHLNAMELKDTDGPNFMPLTIRIARDRWTGPDKRNHLLGGFASTTLTGLIWNANNNPRLNGLAAYNLAFWWLWEVKDALIPWEFWGWWGGDGFSYKDGTVSSVGILAGVFLVKAIL